MKTVPIELVEHIASFLSPADATALSCACSDFKNVMMSPIAFAGRNDRAAVKFHLAQFMNFMIWAHAHDVDMSIDFSDDPDFVPDTRHARHINSASSDVAPMLTMPRYQWCCPIQ
jgi:hypothetical protein